MDVCESEQAFRKHRAVDTQRPPLVPAEKNNEVVVTTRRPPTRDISSRYRSPSRATTTPSSPRRCPSPNPTRITPTSSKLFPKRAQSVERKRLSTPSSPPSPSTPVDGNLSSGKTTGGRFQESLWPSTMRSLSVSFQSDAVSVPISKKEKPNSSTSDRTLRPASNVAHKQAQAETPTLRKPTPERKRSPLKGKNASDHSENSKPVDGLHSRLIDQHRWPSSVGGKASSHAKNRSFDLADKSIRTMNASVSTRTGLSSLRRLSLSEEPNKPLLKSVVSDNVRNLSTADRGRVVGKEVKSVNDSLLQVLRPHKSIPANPSDKLALATLSVRSQSLPTPVSHPSSPSKASLLSPSSARGLSPSRSRPSTPPSRGVSPTPPSRGVSPSRGISPSRIRATNLSSQPSSSISVLSFIADFRKGKKGTSYVDDAHQLRLLHNRYLQWRFANARAEAVLYIQNETAEV